MRVPCVACPRYFSLTNSLYLFSLTLLSTPTPKGHGEIFPIKTLLSLLTQTLMLLFKTPEQSDTDALNEIWHASNIDNHSMSSCSMSLVRYKDASNRGENVLDLLN